MSLLLKDGGGGGGSGSALFLVGLTANKDKSRPLSVQASTTTNKGLIADFTERVFALDAECNIFGGFGTIIDMSAELSVLEGSYDFGDFDLTSKIGTAEASAEIKIDGVEAGAYAAIWTPSASVTIGGKRLTVEIPLGSIGFIFGFGMDGDFAMVVPGVGIKISWEDE